jgi:hypothetical protein
MAEKLNRTAHKIDQDIERELSRLGLEGLTGLTASRERFRSGPNGLTELYQHPSEVDLTDGEVYVRGRAVDILQALQARKRPITQKRLWEVLGKKGMKTGVYWCSWEGEPEDEEDW